MSERNKEQEGITLLGNQHTRYPSDYDPRDIWYADCRAAYQISLGL